jgi:hypothetical protein
LRRSSLGRGCGQRGPGFGGLGTARGDYLLKRQLVSLVARRQVRGGTERYYRRSARRLEYDDEATTAVAFRALAAEIAAAEPDPLLVLRSVRLTAEHARQIREALRNIAELDEDRGSHQRYGLIIGLYQPRQLPPDGEPPQPGDPVRD